MKQPRAGFRKYVDCGDAGWIAQTQTAGVIAREQGAAVWIAASSAAVERGGSVVTSEPIAQCRILGQPQLVETGKARAQMDRPRSIAASSAGPRERPFGLLLLMDRCLHVRLLRQ